MLPSQRRGEPLGSPRCAPCFSRRCIGALNPCWMLLLRLCREPVREIRGPVPLFPARAAAGRPKLRMPAKRAGRLVCPTRGGGFGASGARGPGASMHARDGWPAAGNAEHGAYVQVCQLDCEKTIFIVAAQTRSAGYASVKNRQRRLFSCRLSISAGFFWFSWSL